MTSTAQTKTAKCVVWDLDDTLWNGTLTAGDDTILRPGVLDVLHTLDRRGILLSIASKNNHVDAIGRLTELGIADLFVEPQISWQPKSASIAALQKALNIGMDTIMFIDDQEFERDEVVFNHPEVETIDASDYQSLPDMDRLNPAIVSDEAHRRRAMYLENKQREESEESFQGPQEDFLATLGMKLAISHATKADLLRLEELTLRTNQLNSTGIHFSADDLEALIEDPGHDLWVCELVDRYGSYGKVGMALVRTEPDAWTIRLLLMSCRTVSKGIGTVLLTFLIRSAAENNVRLFADLRRTGRNRQMVLTYQLANFHVTATNDDINTYENDLSILPEYPDYLELQIT